MQCMDVSGATVDILPSVGVGVVMLLSGHDGHYGGSMVRYATLLFR